VLPGSDLCFVVWVKAMSVSSQPVETDSIFVLPVLDEFLVYAPLHGLAALVDDLAARRIRDSLISTKNDNPEHLGEIIQILKSSGAPPPAPKAGDLAPAFLGLIPTRGCNLACEYCGFLTDDEADAVMDLALAREAISWYLELASQSGVQTAEVHFFGGEPFCAERVVDFAFHWAWLKAQELGCSVRFEIATNGTFDPERCQWAADSLDSIVLSLDGLSDVQDRHRHRKDGRGSFEAVVRSAKLLSRGSAELSFRVCVTSETVGRMPEVAAWLCQDFCPVSVSFEPVQPSPQSRAAGLYPPDPWAFAQRFIEAAWILETYGVEPVYAAADLSARRVSFCPVGQDVPIVSPDGTIAACYLLKQEWEAKGLDLELGRVENGSVFLDQDAVAAVRRLNVREKEACVHCFCKWHCAGGCHVNHELSSRPGDYDRLCIQTRIITLRTILRAMKRVDLTHHLLKSPKALEQAVWQASDAIFDL
jgi:uncharacterized protein